MPSLNPLYKFNDTEVGLWLIMVFNANFNNTSDIL